MKSFSDITSYAHAAGVVKRADMIVNGFTFSRVEVGGMDATQKIIEMHESLHRHAINARAQIWKYLKQ